jgi:hypothetical protein
MNRRPAFGAVIQQATQAIPILTVSDDLLAEQAVASLSHPGGNTTGIGILATEFDGKRQEILLEAIPFAHHLALLADPSVTKLQQLKTRHARRTQAFPRSWADCARLRFAMLGWTCFPPGRGSK